MRAPWRTGDPTMSRAAGRSDVPRPRILFPFIAAALSRRALDAALRLTCAEDAVLLPVLLVTVPRRLPLHAPLTRDAGAVVASQEAIEQRAASFGVPVDARLERGRTARDALMRTIDCERYDRIVIAAAAPGAPGFAPGDVAWLLAHAPGEIVVVRPDHGDDLLELERDAAGRRGGTVALPGAFS